MFVQTHQSNLIGQTPKQISLLVPNPNSERKYVDLIEILQMEAPNTLPGVSFGEAFGKNEAQLLKKSKTSTDCQLIQAKTRDSFNQWYRKSRSDGEIR